ncbi:MAG: acyltransferase [Candidatus Hodarchaeota archaeon]
MVAWVIFQIILLASVLFIGIQYYYYFSGFLETGIFLPLFLSILFTLATFLFFFVIIHKIARMLMREEEGILKGRDVALWGIAMTAADSAYFLVNKLFINQIFPVVFYKLFGAKFGKRVAVYSRLWDVELIEIGDDTSIGTGCIIGGHAISQGDLFRKRIKIGRNCTIGAGTIILPGVTIEDYVIVASNSVIPSNRILESNSIYAGSPVKRIKEWNGMSVWKD